MTARYSTTASARFARDSHGESDAYSPFEIAPGERIGRPLRSRRRRLVSKLIILALLASAGGWAMTSEKPLVPHWAASELASLYAGAERSVRELVSGLRNAAPAQQAPGGAEPPQPVVMEPTQVMPQAAPSIAAGEPVEAANAALQAAEREEAANADPDAARPVVRAPPGERTPASDPHRIRAEKVGLHPDLSRALLARLTDADFRNARTAIRAALAQTPDGEVHVWPLKPAAKLARFRVHFVAGAAANCRRYVVAVALDGWATTALPMEKCGIKGPARKAEAKRE